MPGPGDRGGVKHRPKDAKGALRRILKYLMEFLLRTCYKIKMLNNKILFLFFHLNIIINFF